MKLPVLCFCILWGTQLTAQAYCQDQRFDIEVRKYLQGTVPIMDVDTLYAYRDQFLLLDARALEEYSISHLPGAEHIGFRSLNDKVLDSLSREAPIVVYCSIGYRSEIVGEKLKRKGFTNVHNLFGSMFEWVNRGYPVEKAPGVVTDTVHGYSRKWSQWILNPGITRVW